MEHHSLGKALTTPIKTKSWLGDNWAFKTFSLLRPECTVIRDQVSDFNYPTFVKQGLIYRFTLTKYILIIPNHLIRYITICYNICLSKKGPCVKTVFTKHRKGYGQFESIELAFQNKFATDILYIILQQNFLRTNIVFDVLLKTHYSLGFDHTFYVKHL